MNWSLSPVRIFGVVGNKILLGTNFAHLAESIRVLPAFLLFALPTLFIERPVLLGSAWFVGVAVSILLRVNFVSLFIVSSPIWLTPFELDGLGRVFLWPVMLLFAFAIELFWPQKLKSRPDRKMFSFLLWFFCVFTTQLAIFVFFSSAVDELDWKGIRDLLLAGASAFLGVSIASRYSAKKLRDVLSVLVTTAVLIVVVNIVGILTSEEFPMFGGRNRIMFPFNDPNLLAIFLFLGLVALFFLKAGRGPSFLWLGSLLLAGVALTGSRAGFAAAILFWFIAIVVEPKLSVTQKGRGFFAGGTSVVVAWATSWLHLSFFERKVGIFARGEKWSLDGVRGDERLEIFSDSLSKVTAPFAGQTAEEIGFQILSLFLGVGARQGGSPHNVFIQIFVEFGLLGMVLLAVPIFLVVRKIWADRQNSLFVALVSFSGLSFFQGYVFFPLLWFLPALYLARSSASDGFEGPRNHSGRRARPRAISEVRRTAPIGGGGDKPTRSSFKKGIRVTRSSRGPPRCVVAQPCLSGRQLGPPETYCLQPMSRATRNGPPAATRNARSWPTDLPTRIRPRWPRSAVASTHRDPTLPGEGLREAEGVAGGLADMSVVK